MIVASVFVMGAIEVSGVVVNLLVLCAFVELSASVVLFPVVDKDSVDVSTDDVEDIDVTAISFSVEYLIAVVEAVKITSVVGWLKCPVVNCSGLLDVDKSS